MKGGYGRRESTQISSPTGGLKEERRGERKIKNQSPCFKSDLKAEGNDFVGNARIEVQCRKRSGD